MAVKILKKKYLEQDVLEAAKERLRYIYKLYDEPIVFFSGGKDSLVVLYLTIEIAKELNRLPVHTVYIDHEIEGLGTIELLAKVRAMPEVKMYHYAIPFSLRNACSHHSPLWYPFHPAEKDLWVMPKPEGTLTEMEGHYFEYDQNYQHPDGEPYKANGVTKSMSFQEVCQLHIKNELKRGNNVIGLVGLRAEESLSRFKVMAKKKHECWLSPKSYNVYPIYDMLATDVWKYIRDTGLPYNVEYDMMNKTEFAGRLNRQRVGSIFAEESLRTLHQWRELYKGYWHLILDRAEGVKTAWRYNNDGIYTGTKVEKIEGISWEEYTKSLIQSMSEDNRKMSIAGMNKIITWHAGKTNEPIADRETDACPLTGISWQFLCKIAIRGDTKERHLQNVTIIAEKAQKRAGLTRDECVKYYGKPEYQKKYFNENK